MRYYVATYTANMRQETTGADVSITLVGSRGDSGARPLAESRTHQNRFQPDQIDVFTLEAVSLGELQKVIIEYNGTDMSKFSASDVSDTDMSKFIASDVSGTDTSKFTASDVSVNGSRKSLVKHQFLLKKCTPILISHALLMDVTFTK